MAANELIPLCEASEVAPGCMRRVALEGHEPLAVCNVEGTYYVVSDTCTHGEASLANDGALQGCNVECGWHYGAFDVRTGEPTASPCEVPVRAYPVVIDAGKVCIRRG